MLQLPKFKIRCSAIHLIMGGATNRPTEKQMAELDKLLAKGDNLTLNQKMRRDELIEKRDTPPKLLEGAKTYCKQWVKSILYDEPYEFNSKYTDKGTECEQDGIDMVADRMGYGFIAKNEKHYENEFCTGTPDLVLANTVEDVKCPYTSKTFPLFEDELPNDDYYWQLQGYMWLTGKNSAAVNYTLINAPAHIIEQETFYEAKRQGIIDIPTVLYEDMERRMTYDNVPPELKFKRYPFERNEKDIALIERQVTLCREYIETELLKKNPTYLIQLIDPTLPNTTIIEAA